ncbi:hypothetical protein V6N12_048813 [Hibiscus sabdariffa]|uniref:Fcf2 pre-rRNA processing C-terminal domain-containing protein n=1 Tax=Hibiscus sabdariffa TaxID=183260 RepID=A0ABR2EJV7_9ROSI
MAGEVSSFNKDPDVCEEGGLHPRPLQDVRDMGLETNGGKRWICHCLRDTKGVRDPLADHEDLSFFSKLSNIRRKKKYASLFDLHDEALSIKEKRKIDRLLKKNKFYGKRIR